jgi:tRNA-Thr(GGU) m(6)t(6)A37 methyltransferase TsaA
MSERPGAQDVVMRPIGAIHTPFDTQSGTPIQGALARDARGEVEVFEVFRQGLADLDGFSHAVLVYVFHRSEGFRLKVVPYLDDRERGLFATRAPRRPNPIGLTVVRLVEVDEAAGRLIVEGVDMLDGTPLLDIKPHVPAFEPNGEVRTGWLEVARSSRTVADDRFDR